MNIFKKLVAIENEGIEFGFEWSDPFQVLDQIKSECTEIEENLNDPAKKEALKEEIGDLIHAACSLCVFCQFDPEETLSIALQKMEKRLKEVKRLAREKGYTHLKGKSFEDLMALWKEAKSRVG